MNGYISWEENVTEEDDKLVFKGDKVSICYGTAVILRGVCEFTGLTLEQLIELVYGALKETGADAVKPYKVVREAEQEDEE